MNDFSDEQLNLINTLVPECNTYHLIEMVPGSATIENPFMWTDDNRIVFCLVEYDYVDFKHRCKKYLLNDKVSVSRAKEIVDLINTLDILFV